MYGAMCSLLNLKLRKILISKWITLLVFFHFFDSEKSIMIYVIAIYFVFSHRTATLTWINNPKKQINIYNPLSQSFQKHQRSIRDTIYILSLHISFSMLHLSWRDSKNIKQVNTFTIFFPFLQPNYLLNNKILVYRNNSRNLTKYNKIRSNSNNNLILTQINLHNFSTRILPFNNNSLNNQWLSRDSSFFLLIQHSDRIPCIQRKIQHLLIKISLFCFLNFQLHKYLLHCHQLSCHRGLLFRIRIIEASCFLKISSLMCILKNSKVAVVLHLLFACVCHRVIHSVKNTPLHS